MVADSTLVGKYVFVPRHNYTSDKYAFLGHIWDNRMMLFDYDGNSELTSVLSVDVREATKEEVVKDYFKQIGINLNPDELGSKYTELIEGMYAKLLEYGRKYAGKYSMG